MRINLALQLTEDPSFRCPKVRVSTGSAFVVELCGIPAYIAGRAVEAVSVTVTNADGFTYTASCAKFLGDWCAAIPASHFASYGFIAHGLHVSIALAASGGSGSSPSVPATVTTLTRDVKVSETDLKMRRKSYTASTLFTTENNRTYDFTYTGS